MEIVAASITTAWAEAFFAVLEHRALSPLVITVDASPSAEDRDSETYRIVDRFLISHRRPTCNATANTIFPKSLWNRETPRHSLFDRYSAIWPKVRRFHANRHGTYFHRMIAYDNEPRPVNQLDHVIDTWHRGNHRRSALQLGLLDPRHDHVHTRQRGFPCLQQVAIVPQGPNGSKGLVLCAFYPLEYIVDRGLGNYLGLYWLGEFLGYEMGLSFTELRIVASVAETGKQNVGDYRSLREELTNQVRD